MRRIAFTFLGLCLALAPAARADQWSKTFNLTGKPDLRVQTSDANIQVDTWDKNTIEARVTTEHDKIGENGIKISDRQNGDTVELEVRFPHHNFEFNVRPHHVEVSIHMPREGRVYLRTGDGRIRMQSFKGTMDVSTGDGSQELESVDGSLRAHTGDGHIRAEGRFDSLELGSGDGRIDARALAGSTASSNWDIQTGDGSITLQLPETFAADVDLHTSDGHIVLDMPFSVEGQLDKKDIHGKLNGGGTNRLSVHTGDGSIHLQKS
jgi:DUF4097 and DUF4098 domain-containing protein YvlB